MKAAVLGSTSPAKEAGNLSLSRNRLGRDTAHGIAAAPWVDLVPFAMLDRGRVVKTPGAETIRRR
jgi:hypothetical protein